MRSLKQLSQMKVRNDKKWNSGLKSRSFFYFCIGLISFGFNLSIAMLFVMIVVFKELGQDVPLVETLGQFKLNQPMRVYSQDNDLIAEFGDQRRQPMRTSEAPALLIRAILAAEDDRFYTHPGVDLMGLARASVINFRTGDYNQGASTITMQVARNYFLTPEKSYKRKLREILLAIRMEQVWSKEEILDHYLNKIFLGNRSYGFRSAANLYYGKTPDRLTLSEVATLAGLPKAPSRDNPWASQDHAQKRRDYVLGRLLSVGDIDQEQYQQALLEPIYAARPKPDKGFSGAFVAEMARLQVVELFGDQAYTAGYSVYTTVNRELQQRAEQALADGLIAYDRRHGYRGPVAHFSPENYDFNRPDVVEKILQDYPEREGHHAAIVTLPSEQTLEVVTEGFESLSISRAHAQWARLYVDENRVRPHAGAFSNWLKKGDVVYVREVESDTWELSQIPEVEGAFLMLHPDTGAIQAMVGGRDFQTGKFNHVIQARRQPGSTIKPFIFSAALERGYDASSLVSGGPVVLDDPSFQQLWIPQNYDNKFYGLVRLRYALAHSINLVAVRLLQAVGIPEVVDHTKRFGLEEEHIHQGLSMALGASLFTPMEMTRAYAVFANGGHLITPFLIEHIRDPQGNIVYRSNRPVVRNYGAALRIKNRALEVEESAQAIQAPRVVGHANAYLISSMLQDVIEHGTAQSVSRKLAREDLSGKTGTTNDFRDAWFIGFNQDFVATTWVGFDDQRTLGQKESGSKAALPIWTQFMEHAQELIPLSHWHKPDNLALVYVDEDEGRPADATEAGTYPEFFYYHRAPKAVNVFSQQDPTPLAPSNEAKIDLSEGIF